MWYRDLSAKMANRSSSGSVVEEKTAEGSEESLVQKCVVLQKDEHGYGLTVAGDSPTYVQLIKENGAAARAGIQKGDKIIKINGSLVTHCSHSEVNSLLRRGSYVNLTLLGRLTPGGQVTSLRNLDNLKERRADSPSLQQEDISAPRAVDASKAGHYLLQKMMTMKMMQKQIREELEHLRVEYENCPSEQLLLRLEAKKQMLDKVHEQLNSLQEAEAPPRRPFSAGHESPDVLSPGGRTTTEFPSGTPPTSRHKKSDSMPDTLYKMGGVKRQSTQSESRVIEALTEERGSCGGEERSRDQSSIFGEIGKRISPTVDSPSDTRQSPGSLSTSPYQARSLGSMLRKRCLKVVLPSQVKMGTVEDSVFSTLEDPTIFTELEQLKCHPAHLSVFLHYVMPNFDPSPMLFHIITESYPQGSLKEMKKWAYEIYSTFLNEKSPLKVNVEDEVVGAVETTLTLRQEDEESMRNIFIPARTGVTNEILNQLADFRAKRASGLGSIYGDHELRDSMDKATELRIIENGLWKYFERLSMNKNNDRCKALSSALATFFKGVGLSSSKISSSLERCYTFNAKDKKTFKFKTNKKIINGHQYIAQQYYMPTYCHWCHLLFWGIGHQGFQCSHCDINVHKNCVEQMREPCMWSTVKKRKDKKGSQSVFDKIISRKTSANNPLLVKEQHMHDVLPFASPTFVAGFSTPAIHTTAPVLNGENEEMGKRSSSQDPHPDPRVKNRDDSFEVTTDLLGPYNTIGSESLHDKLDAKTNVRRAHSMFVTDRKAHRKKHIDVSPENQPNQPHLSDSSGCSSNSSLSAKSSEVQSGQQHEGDQNSLVSLPVSPGGIVGQSPLLHQLQGQHSFSNFPMGHHHQQHHHQHQQQQLPHPFISHSLSSLVIQPQQLQKHQHLMGAVNDSDFEVESELPSIESYMPKEQLKKLKPKERKRQEVINELFHTEQAHVRNLKVMYRIFYLPMLEEVSLPRDLINLIFPNIPELIECHSSLNEAFKAKRSEEGVVGDFAHILEEKFSGEDGEKLKSMAATFCQNQSHCLEVLRLRQKKDAKFAAFLQEAASHPLCRRLELKDLIPTEMQRLTKYPLLIENLLKYTQTNSTEYEVLQKALGHSKSILSFVNQKVKECENLQKLSDFQRKLDTKPIENSNHPVLSEYKKLDLRRHKMIYDGPLTWRICKSKQLEMHAVLLEDILVLLQKSQDSERLVLRCQSSNTSISTSTPLVGSGGVAGMTGGRDDSKLTHSPIVKLTNILLRDVATDNKAFFLVSISEYGPQIYEFIAMTRDEKNRWVKYIKEAGESSKRRSGSMEKMASPPPMSHSLRGYMSGRNVETTGGQEEETVQPSGSLPLLSSSISSIIPDDVGQLNVAKVDASHQKGQIELGHHPTREVRSRSRSRSCNSDSDEQQETSSDDNMAIVTIVESDGPEEVILVQPTEVKVSTLQILEKKCIDDLSNPPQSHTENLKAEAPLWDLNTQLARAMREKREIVSAALGIPLEHYDNFVEIAEEDAEHSTDVKEILLALFAQTDRLTNLVNEKIDSGANKTSDLASLSFNRMIAIPSSQIRLISMKLDHLLVQLMELLIQQERESAKKNAWLMTIDPTDHLTETEPVSRDPHSTDEESLRPALAPPCDQEETTHADTRAPSYIESSCITNLEARLVDTPKFETGHVLTTSINPLFCGATPLPTLEPPQQLAVSTTLDVSGCSNDGDNNGNGDSNDNDDGYNHLLFAGPPTTIYTSTCQLPRLTEGHQPQRRSGEDEDRSPPPTERALTVL